MTHSWGRPGKMVGDLCYCDELFFQVTKAASEGPKLTHLTTQRPKVKGRRPPKRYATYHEEDKDVS